MLHLLVYIFKSRRILRLILRAGCFIDSTLISKQHASMVNGLAIWFIYSLSHNRNLHQIKYRIFHYLNWWHKKKWCWDNLDNYLYKIFIIVCSIAWKNGMSTVWYGIYVVLGCTTRNHSLLMLFTFLWGRKEVCYPFFFWNKFTPNLFLFWRCIFCILYI